MNQRKHQDDYNLVHQYLCGNKASGQRLYSEAYPILEKFVASRTKGSILNEHDLNDIVLESLKRSVEKLGRFDGSSKFVSWVIGIAQLVIKEHLRKKKKVIFIEDIPEVEYEKTISLFNKDPLMVLLSKETQEAIKFAINQLSSEHQQIIQLRLFNKVPAKEISAITGESESAINSRYIRALKSLRKNLKKG